MTILTADIGNDSSILLGLQPFLVCKRARTETEIYARWDVLINENLHGYARNVSQPRTLFTANSGTSVRSICAPFRRVHCCQPRDLTNTNKQRS
jgi:hypothetical protein